MENSSFYFYFYSLEQTKHGQPSQPMSTIIFLAKYNIIDEVVFQRHFFFAIEKITETT